MLLLASRLGLRVSDIAGLGFKNIDWDASQIKLIQNKTGNPVTLSLLPAVGNAIIDCLRYGRKQSSSGKVFLSCKAPYLQQFSVQNPPPTPNRLKSSTAIGCQSVVSERIEFGSRLKYFSTSCTKCIKGISSD
jgi:integrase